MEAPNIFTVFIRECIAEQPNINLTMLANKLAYRRDEIIDGSFERIHALLLKDFELVPDWTEINNAAWSSNFHPEFGYCHTFDLKKADKYMFLDPDSTYQIIIKSQWKIGLKDYSTPDYSTQTI